MPRRPITKVILQNVQALAAGQSVEKDKDGRPQPVGVLTVLVTPEQAESLALASNQGKIQLALRNTLDTLHIKTDGARANSLLALRPSSGAEHRAAQPRSAHRHAHASSRRDGGRGVQRRRAHAAQVLNADPPADPTLWEFRDYPPPRP